MEAILRVPPARGMVRFIPVAEECLAWGSKTVAGRISDAVARDREVTSEGEGSKAQERRILKVIAVSLLEYITLLRMSVVLTKGIVTVVTKVFSSEYYAPEYTTSNSFKARTRICCNFNCSHRDYGYV
jgi:hypothetical protein